MNVFSPLKHRPVTWLWSGQVLSSLGDEMNKVALAWLATTLLGVRAGYLSSVYAAAAMIFCLFGGRWADNWSRKETLLGSDVGRALAVFAIPLAAALHLPLVWILIPVVIATAALSSFFDPALRASLMQVAPSIESVTATNALMETTSRLARVLGPSFVALLGAWLPMVHFFTLDGISFLCSAASIVMVSRAVPQLAERPSAEISEKSAWKLIRLNITLRRMLLSSIISGGAWIMILPMGMALLVQHRFPGDLRALGWLMAGYGVGNLSSNLAMGSVRRGQRPEMLVFIGRLICGTGFMGMTFAPSLPLMMVCAAVAATGGPIVDIGFLGALQSLFNYRELAKVYRFAGACAWGGGLLMFFISPVLCVAIGVVPFVALAAALLFLGGTVGWLPKNYGLNAKQ